MRRTIAVGAAAVGGPRAAAGRGAAGGVRLRESGLKDRHLKCLLVLPGFVYFREFSQIGVDVTNPDPLSAIIATWHIQRIDLFIWNGLTEEGDSIHVDIRIGEAEDIQTYELLI